MKRAQEAYFLGEEMGGTPGEGIEWSLDDPYAIPPELVNASILPIANGAHEEFVRCFTHGYGEGCLAPDGVLSAPAHTTAEGY